MVYANISVHIHKKVEFQFYYFTHSLQVFTKSIKGQWLWALMGIKCIRWGGGKSEGGPSLPSINIVKDKGGSILKKIVTMGESSLSMHTPEEKAS